MMLSQGDVYLDARFEFEGEMAVVGRHPIKNPPYKFHVVFPNAHQYIRLSDLDDNE